MLDVDGFRSAFRLFFSLDFLRWTLTVHTLFFRLVLWLGGTVLSFDSFVWAALFFRLAFSSGGAVLSFGFFGWVTLFFRLGFTILTFVSFIDV